MFAEGLALNTEISNVKAGRRKGSQPHFLIRKEARRTGTC